MLASVRCVNGECTLNEKKTEPYVSEIAYGRFERSFTLPENVTAEKVNANFENGMLELTLPVNEAAKPHRIEIGNTVCRGKRPDALDGGRWRARAAECRRESGWTAEYSHDGRGKRGCDSPY